MRLTILKKREYNFYFEEMHVLSRAVGMIFDHTMYQDWKVVTHWKFISYPYI